MQMIQIIRDNIYTIFSCLIFAKSSLAIFAVFILFVFKKNRTANFFLAFFILIYSAAHLPGFFYVNNFPIISFRILFITLPANSLVGVFLYFYTLFMTGRSEKLNRKDIIHFLSFIILMIINIFFYSSYFDHNQLKFTIIMRSISIWAIINTIVYTALSFVRIMKYSKDIKNYTSNIKRIDMRWLNKIIYFSILSISIFLISFFNALTGYAMYLVSLDNVVFIIMLFITVFYIINQPELSKENSEMYNILDILNIKNKNNAHPKKYEKINIDIEKQEFYLKMLVEYMDKNKPYLNETITLKDLANAVKLPYHHLSMIVNNLLKKNFYDFINEFRLREVLNILDESQDEVVNILTVAFKCGFNSKSTFNRVFKNKTGITPSEYKKRLMILRKYT